MYHDVRLVTAATSQPPAPSPPPPPPPSTLEDIIAKKREDHQGMVPALHSLVDNFQVNDNEWRAERTKLDKVLQQLSTMLKSVQDQITETSQQQRAQHLTLLRLEQGKSKAWS